MLDTSDETPVADGLPPIPTGAPPLETLPPPVPLRPRTVLYKVDSSRASFAELWRDIRSPLVLIVWLMKLLRIRAPGAVNEPNLPSLSLCRTTEETIATSALERIQATVTELAAVGFDQRPLAYYAFNDLFNNSNCSIAILGRSDGQAVARIMYRTEGTGTPPKLHSHCDIFSALSDGSIVCSTSAAAYLDAPTGVVVHPNIKAAPAHLWASHQAALSGATVRARVMPAIGETAVLALSERYHGAFRDALLARGVFQALDETEWRTNDLLQTTYADATSHSFEHPQILVEIERLQNKSSNWISGALVLIISLLLFIAASDRSSRESAEFALLIIPILLVHELGHFLAMKLFGYRNVSMFFIPFLGAAVKGQHFNVAGWKRVVVALMGPVPGILLGTAVGILGMVRGVPLLEKAGLFAVVINAINLAPVLPLDGGRVVQSIIFARNWVLDGLFQSAAGLVLFGLGLLTTDRILLVLGAFMALRAPLAFKIARLTSQLRRSNIQSSSADSQTIPPQAAMEIVRHVKQAFPKRRSHKALAQITLSIYENINARPPGWAASIGLAGVYFASLVLAMGFGLVIALRTYPSLMSIATAAAVRPTRPIAVDQFAIVRGPAPAAKDDPAAPPSSVERDSKPVRQKSTIIVANFPSAEEARNAFDNAIRDEVAASETAVWLGQSVLVKLSGDDAARRRWFALLESSSDDVFVSGTLAGGAMRLSLIAPTESRAKEIADEVNRYLTLPQHLRLIPPWAADDMRSPAERRQHDRARRTVVRLEAWQTEPHARIDAELKAISADIERAYMRGEQEQAENLSARVQELLKQKQEEVQERISRDAESDAEIARLYLARFAHPPVWTDLFPDDVGEDADDESSSSAAAMAESQEKMKRWNEAMRQFNTAMDRELGPLLGQRPTEAASVEESDSVEGVAFDGSARNDHLFVDITLLRVEQRVEELPEILRWFAARDGTRFTYDLGTSKRNGFSANE